MASAVRLTLDPADEPALEEALAELLVSWSVREGRLSLWVSEGEAGEVERRLAEGGVRILGREREAEKDWVAEAAAL